MGFRSTTGKYKKQRPGGSTRGTTESYNCTATRLFLVLPPLLWHITAKFLMQALNLQGLGFWFVKVVVNMDNTTFPGPSRYPLLHPARARASHGGSYKQQNLTFSLQVPNSFVHSISSLPTQAPTSLSAVWPCRTEHRL